MAAREVEIVHRPRDVEVGVGVEPVDEADALVAQVALDLEVGIEAVGQACAVLQRAAELAVQGGLAEIGDVRRHARHRQAAGRAPAGVQVVAALPVGIGHDRLAADLVEGDVLRRMARRGGDRHGAEHPLGIARRPLQHLHPAHRAADHAEQPLDAQMVEQQRLQPDHVADGDHREAEPEGLAGRDVAIDRAGGAHAAAQHVGADHEVALGVERQARPDRELPPAGLAGHRVAAGGELVAGQRVADQDGVGALGVEAAVGLVGDVDRAELGAAVELERHRVREPGAVAGQAGGIQIDDREDFWLGHLDERDRVTGNSEVS